MKILKILLIVVIGVAIGVAGFMFTFSNAEVITVDYLAGSLTTSVANVVIGAFILGGLLGLLSSIFMKISLLWHKWRAKKQLASAESEVSALRAGTAKS